MAVEKKVCAAARSVSDCTFVLVKQVKCIPETAIFSGLVLAEKASICTFVPVKQVKCVPETAIFSGLVLAEKATSLLRKSNTYI